MDLSITNMVSTLSYTQKFEPLKKDSKIEQTNSSVTDKKASVYADDKEKKENDEMLRKMQMSETKLESLGEYFGAMQEALKDSGSDGIMAYRRTNNLIRNGTDYMDTEEYQEKDNSKCLVKDLTDRMEESKEALEEKQEAKKETEEEKPLKEEESLSEKVSTINLSLKDEKANVLEIAKQTAQTAENYSGKTIDISL